MLEDRARDLEDQSKECLEEAHRAIKDFSKRGLVAGRMTTSIAGQLRVAASNLRAAARACEGIVQEAINDQRISHT